MNLLKVHEYAIHIEVQEYVGLVFVDFEQWTKFPTLPLSQLFSCSQFCLNKENPS